MTHHATYGTDSANTGNCPVFARGAAMRIGIDLGGTKIEIACMDDAGDVLLRRRVATPQGDYRATLAAIAALVRDAETAVGRTGTVGLGIPGSISTVTGAVRNANSTWLNGRRLGDDLRDALGREVRVQNDANCLAVSEALDGAAAGLRVVFAAILGTGVGAGIAIDGRAFAGANGVAGEWGHVPLPAPEASERPGPRCWCGREGCIETWLSGPALAADHLRATGERLDAATLVARAQAGAPSCAASLDRWLERLARGLALIVDVLDPDAIVLGGGLSNTPGLERTLPARIAPHVFSDTLRTPILRSRHGDSSGVRGAARLWDDARGSRE
jgi:fructokinase